MNTDTPACSDHDGIPGILHNGEPVELTRSEVLAKCWNNYHERCVHMSRLCPLEAFDAIKTHLHLDEPLPESLKKWFIDGLDKHQRLRGKEITLDKIFGLKDREHQRNAYTKAEKSKTPELIFLMECLLEILDIGKTDAARLAIWREQSTSITPESLATNYTRQQKEKNRKTRVFDSKEDARRYLSTFAEPKIGIVAPDVDELISRVNIAIRRIDSITSSEYEDIIKGY